MHFSPYLLTENVLPKRQKMAFLRPLKCETLLGEYTTRSLLFRAPSAIQLFFPCVHLQNLTLLPLPTTDGCYQVSALRKLERSPVI